MFKRYWKRGVGIGLGYTFVRWAGNKYRSSIEREVLCAEAIKIGDERIDYLQRPYKLLLFSNPESGQNLVKDRFREECAPVLHLAGIDYHAVETEFGGDAKQQATTVDLSDFDGVVVLGGDALVQEVITGEIF